MQLKTTIKDIQLSESVIVGFVSWFLLRFYYVFRLVKYALKGLHYG